MSATKTVTEFFDQRVTSLAAATRYEFSALTLQAAETAGRSFTSVHLEIMFHDDSAAATAISSWLIGIKLGSASFSDVTVTDSLAFGSETKGYILRSGDLSSYFNTNFGSGATQTCQVAIQFGTAPTINHTCKIVYTYSYDWESSDTRTGQLVIPVESWDAYLSTALTEIGTNQLPALTGGSGLLQGMGSVSIKEVSIVFDTLCGREDNVDLQFGVQIDAEAEQLDGLHEQALISHYRYRRVYRFSGKAASYWDSAHAIKVRGTQNGWFKAAILIYVTYTYSESGTTGNAVQSIAVPFKLDGMVPDVTQGYFYTDVEVDIQEPGTITLLQSGVQYYWRERYGTAQAQVKVGTQAAKTYYVTTTPGGMSINGITHRIDSGSSSGAGVTLARGKNTIRIYLGINAGFDGLLWAVTGVLWLNYRSSQKATDTFRHNTTLVKHVQATTDNNAGTRYGNWTMSPHTGESWKLSAMGLSTAYMSPNTTALGAIDVETATGLFVNLFRDYFFGSSNLDIGYVVTPIGSLFKRYALDPDASRGDPTTTKRWRWTMSGDGGSNPGFVSAELFYTLHAISYSVSGTVSGYTGDGSGISVSVYNATTHELLTTATTSAGGAYSATVYDNAVSVYAAAQQDATHKGRSANGTAGASTFNIVFRNEDATAPVITTTLPTAKGDPLVVTIYDVGSSLLDYRITVRIGDGARMELYNSDEGFMYPVNAGRSSASGSGTAGDPYRFTIYHLAYWPTDIPISVYVWATDTVGNRQDTI
jgi:hypothetical protein